MNLQAFPCATFLDFTGYIGCYFGYIAGSIVLVSLQGNLDNLGPICGCKFSLSIQCFEALLLVFLGTSFLPFSGLFGLEIYTVAGWLDCFEFLCRSKGNEQ